MNALSRSWEQNRTQLEAARYADATENPNLRLSIRHFGPVSSGEIELKPLTVLIGANNSGKTYVAQLAYVLSKVLSARSTGLSVEDVQGMLFEALLISSGDAVSGAPAYRPPESMNSLLNSERENFISLLESDIQTSLQAYFGVERLSDLVQNSAPADSLSIGVPGILGASPLVKIGLNSGLGYAKTFLGDIMSIPLDVGDHLERMRLPFNERIAFSIVETGWIELAKSYGILDRAEYYLPSARSGILTSWPLITSMAISVVRRRIGPERIEVAALSGVAGDFLETMNANFLSDAGSRRTANPAMQPVLDVLEGTLLKGKVDVEDTHGERSLLLYASKDVNVPVQRASSMVAELAPLDLWIRYLLQPGDLLVIDEPEAHLHPQAQRQMARVLVRLVNAGVRVICPTHSSLILHQLSNHILAKDASEADRAALGFTDEDVLESDQVGVYLFDVGADGTQIKPVPIIDGFGISEDEFAAVAEQIGDETYRLARSGARAGNGSA